MKKLIVIRIVHAPCDMGSMKDGLEKEGISKIGRQRWEENQRRISKFWDEVERDVNTVAVDPKMLRIYQDGLPCAGALGERIVRETAERGSRNYSIIRDLMERGARVEATESPELLREEYNYIKAIIEAKTDVERAEAVSKYDKIKDKLLEDRDSFIARSISSTLKDDEIGILFIGASHNILPRIAKDIDVKCLD